MWGASFVLYVGLDFTFQDTTCLTKGMYSLAHEGITLDGASKSCLDRQVRVRVRGEGSDQPQAPSLVERERGVWGLPTPHPQSKAKQSKERERECHFDIVLCSSLQLSKLHTSDIRCGIPGIPSCRILCHRQVGVPAPAYTPAFSRLQLPAGEGRFYLCVRHCRVYVCITYRMHYVRMHMYKHASGCANASVCTYICIMRTRRIRCEIGMCVICCLCVCACARAGVCVCVCVFVCVCV